MIDEPTGAGFSAANSVFAKGGAFAARRRWLVYARQFVDNVGQWRELIERGCSRGLQEEELYGYAENCPCGNSFTVYKYGYAYRIYIDCYGDEECLGFTFERVAREEEAMWRSEYVDD